MPQYLAPGVYVEEVPSGSAPIAGVSTSTAGFVGLVPDTLDLVRVEQAPLGLADGSETTFDLDRYPIVTAGEGVASDRAPQVFVNGAAANDATVANVDDDRVSRVTFATAPHAGAHVTISYT